MKQTFFYIKRGNQYFDGVSDPNPKFTKTQPPEGFETAEEAQQMIGWLGGHFGALVVVEEFENEET